MDWVIHLSVINMQNNLKHMLPKLLLLNSMMIVLVTSFAQMTTVIQLNLSGSHTICTNQDLRNLRCAKGSTTLEDKNILKCNNCGKAYTSDELATIAVA